MRLSDITRLLAVAGAVLFVTAAMPAAAQVDVTVTATPPEHGDPAVVGINVGVANEYEVVITNEGADPATNVTLTVTLPAPLEFATSAFAGCVRSTTAPSQCSVATLAAGASATITVNVVYPTPDPVPAACNTGETVGEFTASVVATEDTTPATATIATTPVNEFANLAVAVTPPSAGIGDGGTLPVHVVVTNNGPCDATAALAEFAYPAALSFESGTDGTPAFCSGTALADAFAAYECDMGDLVPGATRSFDAVLRLASLPSDLLRAVFPFSVTASSDTHDNDSSDNSGTAEGVFDEDDGGCSTGGAGTLLGLLSLVALRLGRRRSS